MQSALARLAAGALSTRGTWIARTRSSGAALEPRTG
jgi:hypothetical protein